MQLENITAARLKDVLGRMRCATSAGAEGWRVAELKKLPEQGGRALRVASILGEGLGGADPKRPR